MTNLHIKLYKYSDKNFVANKVFGLNPVVDQRITTDGAFDSRSVSFRLSTLYDVNFGCWYFNNKWWYGFCDVSVMSDGLYLYKMTIDPLSTCWYNNCMNVTNSILYSATGSADVKDQRISYKSSITQRQFLDQTPRVPRNNQYVVTILGGHPSEVASKINNPVFHSYLMDLDSMIKFVGAFYDLTPENQKQFGHSIVGCYIVQDFEAFNEANFEQTRTITLYGLSNDGYSSANITLPVDAGRYYYAYKIDKPSSGARHIYSEWQLSLPGFPAYEPWMADMVIDLYIPDMGFIHATYGAIHGALIEAGERNPNIRGIGYFKEFDFVSGRARAWLVVNQYAPDAASTVELRNFYLDTPIQLQFPILYDTSVTNWRQINTSLITSGISTITSAVGAAVSGGLLIPIAVGAGMNLANQISNVQAQKFQEKLGGYSTSGGVGGSTQYLSNPFVFVFYNEPINLNSVQDLWGKPDGLNRNISTLSGYVQTNECKLFNNGLPKDIIVAGEEACNNGIYIKF